MRIVVRATGVFPAIPGQQTAEASPGSFPHELPTAEAVPGHAGKAVCDWDNCSDSRSPSSRSPHHKSNFPDNAPRQPFQKDRCHSISGGTSTDAQPSKIGNPGTAERSVPVRTATLPPDSIRPKEKGIAVSLRTHHDIVEGADSICLIFLIFLEVDRARDAVIQRLCGLTACQKMHRQKYLCPQISVPLTLLLIKLSNLAVLCEFI